MEPATVTNVRRQEEKMLTSYHLYDHVQQVQKITEIIQHQKEIKLRSFLHFMEDSSG